MYVCTVNADREPGPYFRYLTKIVYILLYFLSVFTLYSSFLLLA